MQGLRYNGGVVIAIVYFLDVYIYAKNLKSPQISTDDFADQSITQFDGT